MSRATVPRALQRKRARISKKVDEARARLLNDACAWVQGQFGGLTDSTMLENQLCVSAIIYADWCAEARAARREK